MDHLARLIPLFILLAFLTYLILRMNRSMKLQKEAVDRQKDGMGRVEESLALSREGIAIAKAGAEMQREMLEELRAIKTLLEKGK